MDRRVTEHPILEDIRKPDTYIIHDGKRIPAVTGEPIAAALLAAGVRVMIIDENLRPGGTDPWQK